MFKAACLEFPGEERDRPPIGCDALMTAINEIHIRTNGVEHDLAVITPDPVIGVKKAHPFRVRFDETEISGFAYAAMHDFVQ